jgi:hypothetical protein
VNGDGNKDLVLHYNTHETGIDSGDTQACLTGETVDGVAIQGCDSISLVGDLPPGGPTRIDCGGYVAFTNTSLLPVSVSVTLTDHCAEFDSEITCRRNVDDPESQYDAAIVPDGHSGGHVCEDLPPLGGGVFVVCNGVSGGCSIHIFRVSPGPGPG